MAIDQRNLAGLDPAFRLKIERILKDLETFLGHRAYVASGRRTEEQQRKLVEAGRSKTLRSKHLKGLAADIVPVGLGWNAPRDFWLKLGYLAYREGLRWGGEFGIPKGALLERLRADVRAKRWNTQAKLGWDPSHLEV